MQSCSALTADRHALRLGIWHVDAGAQCRRADAPDRAQLAMRADRAPLIELPRLVHCRRRWRIALDAGVDIAANRLASGR